MKCSTCINAEREGLQQLSCSAQHTDFVRAVQYSTLVQAVQMTSFVLPRNIYTPKENNASDKDKKLTTQLQQGPSQSRNRSLKNACSSPKSYKEVKYMCAWSAVHAQNEPQEKHFHAVHNTELVHLMQYLNVSDAVRRVGITSHNFGRKKHARSAKCVHLKHRTMTNAVHRGNKVVHTPTNAVHKNVAQNMCSTACVHMQSKTLINAVHGWFAKQYTPLHWKKYFR